MNNGGGSLTNDQLVTTRVTFNDLSPSEIIFLGVPDEWYTRTGAGI